MSSMRTLVRCSRMATRNPTRNFSTTPSRLVETNDRHNDTAPKYRQYQINKPLNPHMTNSNSTIANEMPSVGKDSAPPELITSVDPDFTPKDSKPENTERMVGGTQKAAPKKGVNADLKVTGGQKRGYSTARTSPSNAGENADLKVGEIEGGQFRVEPLRRTGEDANTMRARLLYQSRKRGTLESDLLLSTFADANLAAMTAPQLQQYDLFLDENDWDIYYWVTQEPTPTSMAYAEGAGPLHASPEAQGEEKEGQPERAPDGGAVEQTDKWRGGGPRSGEWAQTVGTFKPAYRPVPARWKNSEILSLLRKHVIHRSAGGVHISEPDEVRADGKPLAESTKGSGLGMMPELKNFDA